MDMEFDYYTITGVVFVLLLIICVYFYWCRKSVTNTSQSYDDTKSDTSSDDGKKHCEGDICYR